MERIIPLDGLGAAVDHHDWAYIQVTRQECGETYQWIGPEDGRLMIARQFLEEMPDLLDRLPWKLKRLYEHIEADAVIYRRA